MTMTHLRPAFDRRSIPGSTGRWLLLPALLLLLATPAAAQSGPSVERVGGSDIAESARYQGRQRESQTERETRTAQIGANGELDIQNIAGDIVVTRGSGNRATIEIVKTARAESASDAREMLSQVNVVMSERGGRTEIRTEYPRGEQRGRQRNFSVSVTFTISAPAGASITAKSISGNVSVRDISGEIAAETVSGDVTISNAARVATAKTISGNVRISEAALDNALEASSVSGDVILTRATATRLSLSTVSGNVIADEVSCPRVEMQAVSGRVEYKGGLAASGRYELTSHSGDVRLTVGGDTGFEVRANSFSGSVRSDVPVTLRGDSGDSGDRRGRQRSLRGVYGNGSAVLELTTFSGTIVIAKP